MLNAVDRKYLEPGIYTDSAHPGIIRLAGETIRNISGKREQAIRLYYRVRDGWHYNPYKIDLRPNALKASDMLHRNHGYCVEKANLLAALARAAGIPARLGFANVRNHLGTSRLEKLLQSDLMVFHGYTELFIDGRWVKATPAFNRELCRLLNVEPLEFDGIHDSQFQQATADGKKFMQYVFDYGTFSDVPREIFINELLKHYPHLTGKRLLKGDEYIILE